MKRVRTRKKEGPVVVKAGSVAVKIYTVKNRGRDLFTLTYRGTEGKLVRRQFANFTKARTEADLVATKIQNGQADVLELSALDRSTYVEALALLRPTGHRLDLAAAQFVEAIKVLNGSGSIVEAARFFAKHHPVALPRMSTKQVYEEYLAAKKADGAAPRYLQDIRSRLKRFAERFNGLIAELNGQEIAAWIGGLDVGAVAKNSMRAMIVTFFNFAKQRGYLPKNQPTEAEELPLAKEKPVEIGIFTPDQMRTLLTAAKGPHRIYLAIGGFAGLRQAELMRLEWPDVKLEQEVIVVSAKAAKTSQRRIVPILSNLAEWLAPGAQQTGPIFHGDGSRFLNKVTSLAKSLNIAWPHNGLRHSFASYRVAQTKNVAQVALEMGNSSRMVFQHYRELVAPADADKWWRISPAPDGNA